jgi:hypothetical protein
MNHAQESIQAHLHQTQFVGGKSRADICEKLKNAMGI